MYKFVVWNFPYVGYIRYVEASDSLGPTFGGLFGQTKLPEGG